MAPKLRNRSLGPKVKWAPVETVVPEAERESSAVADEVDAAVADEVAAQALDAASQSSLQSATTIIGDSVHSDDEANAAVAAGAPLPFPHFYLATPHAPRGHRDTRPKENYIKPPPPPEAVAQRNDAEHVGNVGWLFGNWGKLPRQADMRKHLQMELKRNPAMVIGLAECQLESETLLRAPGCEGDKNEPEGSLENRDSYRYLTLRGAEESSILIGIRQSTGNDLELLFWERRHEGAYKRCSGRGHAEAYSRCIVARITTDSNVGFLGKTHNVMVIHVHNHLANNRFGTQKLKAFWQWLLQKLKQYDVRVLMGDFNMALFRVIPELRSCGAVVDLAAWFPWKTYAGTAMSDSCGIFFVNMPGEYSLCKGLRDLHDQGPDGVLTRALPAVAGDPESHGFVRCSTNGGPGQTIATYLPKNQDLQTKLEASLTPSDASEAAVAAKEKGTGKGGKTQHYFKVREKRLNEALWRCDGQEYKGSHFPICAFTNNVGRRSPQALAARHKRCQERLKSKSSGDDANRAAVAATSSSQSAARDDSQWPRRDASRSSGDAWQPQQWQWPRRDANRSSGDAWQPQQWIDTSNSGGDAWQADRAQWGGRAQLGSWTKRNA